MPTPNLLNPTANPYVDERNMAALRRAGLLAKETAVDAYNNPGQVARGAATAPFTLAPDMLGLLGLPISGDPIREAAGMDLSSKAGLLGEFLDPTSAIGKGVKAASGLLDPALAMTLFHGTPHKFNMFDMSKIGTGEGNQAYGHGMYFAENPGVAKTYQSNLSSFNGVKYKGREIPGSNIAAATDDAAVNEVLAAAANGGDVKQSLRNRRKFLMEDAEEFGPDPAVKNVDEALARFDEIIKDVEIEKGHLYEVDIPDETIDKMLDWDAPLSEQPKALQDAIANNPEAAKRIRMATSSFGELKGEQIYEVFAQLPSGGMSRDQRAASAMLSEAGIPGIRFYDGNSRAAGEGTRNIVVFDPNDIRQVKRDGELVYEAGK